jgi:glycosyltransferase involved in cell wall biosynthesis
LRIAQVAPLHESVPPRLYGGTERVVSYLTEELVRLGHDVTLFASGDSRTSAKLVPCCPESLRLAGTCTDPVVPHLLMLEQVFARAEGNGVGGDFDIVHFHCDYLHYPLSRRSDIPNVTTLHGRVDMPELGALYREYSEVPLVSISDAQRAPIPWANWTATVHHGLPLDLYPAGDGRGGYLVFTGRFAREKRPDWAVEIARRAGMDLVMAAKVDPSDRDYFEREIRHLLDQPGVTYVGEVDDRRKAELLGNAAAMIFPIDWPEPFGLVMIESLACGTPVIARRAAGSSVPEIISHGESGLMFDTLDEAVDAVRNVRGLSRARCREFFEERFSVHRMASDYLEVYQRRANGAAIEPAALGAANARRH